MRTQDIEAVREQRIFSGVDPNCVDDMLHASFLQRFPPHVELVSEGEPADFLYVVIEGQVEVFARYCDRETTISVLGPGSCFITAAVVLDRVYLKSVRSLTNARTLLIPAAAIRRCFAQDAAFARALATDLALAYRSVVKDLKNQKLRSGIERLANWLLVAHAESGSAASFTLPFEKKILAARLGMAPEVLSRAFATLSAYQVHVTGSNVEIGDLEALHKLARPVPTIDDASI